MGMSDVCGGIEDPPNILIEIIELESATNNTVRSARRISETQLPNMRNVFASTARSSQFGTRMDMCAVRS